MHVRTLFFAAYRETVGARELDLELPAGATVRDLVDDLRRRGGAWTSLPEAPAVAVNRTYSALDTPLAAGDEVAFLPPVAGG